MMHLDEKTGLLYIEEVPFTLDHLKKIRKLFKYGNKICEGRFLHEVIVTDSGNQFNVPKIKVSVTIDEDLITDIFRLYDIKKIARDEQFTM